MYKVLFLASWYPSRVDPFNGDFIERHAKSISLLNQVFVINVVKDPSIKNGKVAVDKQVSGNLISFTGYYPYSKSKILWIEKIHSNYLALKLYREILKTIRDEYGMPDIIHLNVLMKAGVFARRLNKKYKLPYVITEHWTGYSRERKDGFRQQNILHRKISKKIFENCALALPVTKDLGEKMNELFGVQKSFEVIPNAVDTELFFPSLKNKNVKKRFIHASSLGYHKNIRGILSAAEKLYQNRQDFELYLVGYASKEIIEWTKKNRLLNTCIFFTGLLSYQQVAENFQKADALLMFSRYENLPCVVLEALCSGLPVISTDVGGIREVVNDENGILIESENELALLKAMDYLLDKLENYDRMKIALAAKEKFNFVTVGRQFDEAYKSVLGR